MIAAHWFLNIRCRLKNNSAWLRRLSLPRLGIERPNAFLRTGSICSLVKEKNRMITQVHALPRHEPFRGDEEERDERHDWLLCDADVEGVLAMHVKSNSH